MVLRTPDGAYGERTAFSLADVVILVIIVLLIFGGVLLAVGVPPAILGPEINLSLVVIPYYTLLSVGRMAAAYLLSLLFALSYGYAAASGRAAERGLLPLLDVLQSVPILSFLPVALLSLSAFLPEGLAAELASIFLIFTSMAWNIAFSAYQSFSTIPLDLDEASRIFRFRRLFRFRVLELPFAMRSLLWNSLLSWAGGWFFLIAAETFQLGERDFRLPGLGSYLQAAAQAGDSQAVIWGLVALTLTIVALDQLVWRPALAWAERYRLELVESVDVTRSWLYDFLSRSWLAEQFLARVWEPIGEWFDRSLPRVRLPRVSIVRPQRRRVPELIAAVLVAVAVVYGTIQAVSFLIQLPADQWLQILASAGATALRVALSVVAAALWTIPAGVLIGTNKRVAYLALPIVQVVASIPATAIFPILVVALINLPGGLNVAAILLMLLGTQWYVLFNVIAGAASIPQDLYDTASTLGLSVRLRWSTLVLPALYPYLVTGLITASGGAWNASIVAEYVVVNGEVRQVRGIGALIAGATAQGKLVLLFAATVTLIVVVVAINRVLWRPVYDRAAERYRLE